MHESSAAGVLLAIGTIVGGIGTLFWSVIFISHQEPKQFLIQTLTYIFGIVTLLVSLMAAFVVLRMAVSIFFGV